MNSVAARVRPFAEPRVSATSLAATVAGVALLVAVSLVLHSFALGAALWIDEGLSFGIASHGLGEIPGLLRQDGSPPLYYLALHLWMSAVGKTPEALRGLSLLAVALSVPAGLWAGWSLFGRRAGWLCAALFALNPFLVVYGQETRMYAWVALLSLLVAATFTHAFVLRRRRYLPAFSLALVALLYTHNWGLYLGLGTGVAFLVCLRLSAGRRSLLLDGAGAFGAVALLYAPWLPTLAFQAAHTGAPWSNGPTFRAAEQITGGLLGDAHAATALLLVAGAGAAAIWRGRADATRTAAVAGTAMLACTVLVAFVVAKVAPGWAVRYFAVFLGPLLLLLALGLSRAGRLGLVAAGVALAFWAVPMQPDDDYKSNVARVTAVMNPQLRPGDLAISTQPETVPQLNYYLPAGLRYATPLGPVADPRVMDWRDGMERLRASGVSRSLTPLLDGTPVGRQVLLVRPFTTRKAQWKAPWTKAVRRRSNQWFRALRDDRRFTLVASVQDRSKGTWNAVRATLYRKTSS